MAAIIAMKGPPFTQKSDYANLIASSLGCPVLSLEHFLDSLPPSNNSSPNDLGFEIICRISKHHLLNKISEHVVIDSPLSPPHLRQLIELASSISPSPQVVVLECKPKNIYLWRLKFEQYVADNPSTTRKWYKAKNWQDVEKAIKDNDYDDTSFITHKLVSKLVVDPLLDKPIDDVSPYTTNAHRIIDIVKYMIECEGKGGDVVIYHKWKQSRFLSSSFSQGEKEDSDSESTESSEKWSCNENGHNIFASTVVEEIEYEANCMACQKQITRSDKAYSCKHCSLALHKECAESFDNTDTQESPFPTSLMFPEYRFPEEYPCTSCKEDEKGYGFYAGCGSCLFETHLKCRLMPTVIKHVDTEEHLLTIVLSPALASEVYRCVVCGGSDKFNIYLCKICGVAYHYGCLTLPRRVEHEHGAHHHHLSMMFSSEEADDYICHECLELRDPGLWFYSCEECAYEVHLSCVHQKSFVTPEV